jgi:trimethylamine--corrinoid protein Co-methyltransferase
MTISSIQVCPPRYRLLSAGQIDRIHTATLQLLETVGVSIRHQGARDMLAGAGCRVRNDKTVLIPAQLVADAIQSAPSEVVIYNRLGEKALHLEGHRIHFGPGTDLARVYDLDTGRLRTSTLKDVQAAVRIADALPEIDFIASYVIPNDSPPHLLYLDAFKVQLEHSTKPILFTAAGLEDIRSITEMAVAVAGSRDNLRRKPFVIHYSEPLSPLVHDTGAVEKLLFSADHHIPVIYTPGIMSGATGPVTLAGALVMGNAEALSGLVIHQLRSKGAPIISGIGMAVMDMARSTCIYGCPESRLILSACAVQAGMEWGDSLLLNAMAGVNLIHDVGYMGQGLVGHPAALVVCDEIISYTRRMMRGFILDDAHVDLDAIGRVGAGGSFLSTRQTARLFKSEHWYPNLCNRDSVGAWQKNGRQDMAARAVEKARDILRIPPVEAIDASLQKELDNMRSRAEKS